MFGFLHSKIIKEDLEDEKMNLSCGRPKTGSGREFFLQAKNRLFLNKNNYFRPDFEKSTKRASDRQYVNC